MRRRIRDAEEYFEGPPPDRADLVDPRQLVLEVEASMPSDCAFVFGSGHQRDLGVMHLRRWRGPHISSDGAIGQGLSSGIGSAMARPDRPTVVIEGDAGVLMNIQELNTVMRYRLPLLLLVMNNAALGSELYQMPGHGLPAELATARPTDFAAEASGFGCRAVTLPGPVQPTVVDARIDPEVMSYRFRGRLAAT